MTLFSIYLDNRTPPKMSNNYLGKTKSIYLNEKKFNSLQKSAHFQMLVYVNRTIFFVPLPNLAKTFSHQAIIVNEKTGIPEQVYYDHITTIVIDGLHFEVKATPSSNFFSKIYWRLSERFA